MRSNPIVLVLTVACALAGAACSAQQCIRHSDCPPALVCSTYGICEVPPADDGGGDAGSDAGSDALSDGAPADTANDANPPDGNLADGNLADGNLADGGVSADLAAPDLGPDGSAVDAGAGAPDLGATPSQGQDGFLSIVLLSSDLLAIPAYPKHDLQPNPTSIP